MKFRVKLTFMGRKRILENTFDWAIVNILNLDVEFTVETFVNLNMQLIQTENKKALQWNSASYSR